MKTKLFLIFMVIAILAAIGWLGGHYWYCNHYVMQGQGYVKGCGVQTQDGKWVPDPEQETQ